VQRSPTRQLADPAGGQLADADADPDALPLGLAAGGACPPEHAYSSAHHHSRPTSRTEPYGSSLASVSDSSRRGRFRFPSVSPDVGGDARRECETRTSTHWSGDAVDGAADSVTDVAGSWVVPAATGPAGGQKVKALYSSFWVGIDGDNSNTVEQTDTDSDWVNGQPV
jgi:hypothetical protein